MKVFLGWTTEIEREVAVALGDWLPSVVPDLKIARQKRRPDSSANWQTDVVSQLRISEGGIICLTFDSLFSSTPMFLGGLAAATSDGENVWLYVLDMAPNELRGPLRRFPSATANCQGTRRLIKALCQNAGRTRTPSRNGSKTFASHWKELAGRLSITAKKAQDARDATDSFLHMDPIDRDNMFSGI